MSSRNKSKIDKTANFIWFLQRSCWWLLHYSSGFHARELTIVELDVKTPLERKDQAGYDAAISDLQKQYEEKLKQ